MPEPTGPRFGRIGGLRSAPTVAAAVEPEPEPEVAEAEPEVAGPEPEVAEAEPEPADGWAANLGVDALVEQLGEAAPAVLEHVVNAARELMRAAKAVVDAAEGKRPPDPEDPDADGPTVQRIEVD